MGGGVVIRDSKKRHTHTHTFLSLSLSFFLFRSSHDGRSDVIAVLLFIIIIITVAVRRFLAAAATAHAPGVRRRHHVREVDALFGLTHTCVSLRDDAVFLSFEVGRDQAASDVSPSFDAYYESREPRADDALASIDYVNTTTGATKGTFRSMPALDSSLPCEFYWTCEKSDGTSTQFHVGVPWDHARGWLADAFGHRLVESLSDIPYVSNHRFELCDNADASGRRRVALYGIV